MNCRYRWHVDAAGEPAEAGELVSCIREKGHRGRRHIARHPTELGEFVFVERVDWKWEQEDAA